MKAAVRVLGLGLAALLCTGQAAPERIEYTLTPVLQEGALVAVQYDLRFRGDADGETSLRLPQSWGGYDELWRGIDALEAVSGATISEGDGPGARVLTHRPNARLHMRYRVVQSEYGPPRAAGHGNPYRPVVQPTYFHLIGEASLVTPAERSAETPVRWRVRNLPRGWSLASDLEREGLTLAEVLPSVVVGGDFRVLHDRDANVRLAIRGAWSFSDADFHREASTIIAAQRAFFGDSATPYLVTVLQLDAPEGRTSIGGTGLNDSFAFFATRNATPAPITRTLGHEGSHTWIPFVIGGLSRENEIADYWLSEGFTDFYTGRLLVHGGVWGPREFADDLNGMLRAYAQSPVREAANAQVVESFWSSQPMQQLPYQRGRFLATVWDARLRAAGHGLDNVVLAMRERARGGDARTATELFPDVAMTFGVDTRADIKAYAIGGAMVRLPEDAFAPCGRVTTAQMTEFHRGFDIEATSANGNVVAGVDPALPAYAAGMRDGMVLVRREAGVIGDSETEIAYVMRDGDQERTFHYMPRGHGRFEVQTLVLADDLAGERLAQCIAVLGG